MFKTTSFIFFCSILSLSSCTMSKEQYKQVIETANKTEEFQLLTHTTLIFTVDVISEIDVYISRCIVLFTKKIGKYGKAIMGKECGDKLMAEQPVDQPTKNLMLPYRCFKIANPTDYELHFATITEIKLEKDKWKIRFTLQKADSCRPRWLSDQSVVNAMYDHFRDNGQAKFSTDKPKPLTKAEFEAAFNEPYDNFNLPFETKIFSRNFFNSSQFEPFYECLIYQVELGKGEVSPKCFQNIESWRRIDANFENLLIPYRCFIGNSTTEYELHNTTIDDIQVEDDKGWVKHVVYFTPKPASNCQLNWNENLFIDFVDLQKSERGGDKKTEETTDQMQRDEL